MSKTFNKVKDYLQSSIRYLTSPTEWVRSYELALQFFPHLKTLIVDDIDLDKITNFVAKSRKEEGFIDSEEHNLVAVTCR